MAKYGRGLNREIVAAVNAGLITEPFSTKDVRRFIKIKRWQPEPTENYINVTLANGASDKHSTTFQKYFSSVGDGRYNLRTQYRVNNDLPSNIVRSIKLKTDSIKTIAHNYIEDSEHIFSGIDKIIEIIDQYRQEPGFSETVISRKENIVSEILTENRIFEIFTNLIAYSQNANSELVEKIIKKGIFKEIFANFDINEVTEMNPCDLADKYWPHIRGIRQQSKLFHIVSLARKMKRIGSFSTILTNTKIPRQITSDEDIAEFWYSFKKLQRTLSANKIPFFQSTISLLHFLLDTGYDCIKPDLVVMKVSKKLGIVENVKGESNLIKTVKTIQQYSIRRKIRPTIVDFYFLIEEGQRGAKKYVTPDFYYDKAKR
ncbi:MAG: hypothetical protein ACLPN1_16415 [Dissulfurispiraceae bacterium]